MRLNENQKIVGQKCILIPYCKQHVKKYNEWMQDEELLYLTASEKLTLEQEYEMQQSWHLDESKLTFIVLDRQTFEETNDEIAAMAGDINAFLVYEEDDQSNGSNQPEKYLEISLMIAELQFRKRGLALEALALMVQYIQLNKICDAHNSILAKIDEENSASRRVFQKTGFHEFKYDKIFKSFTYRLDLKRFAEIQKHIPMQIQFYKPLSN